MTLPYTIHDIEVAARTMWGEARGEGEEGMRLVADVLWNRAADSRRWPMTISGVAQQKWQFSAWNANDPNLPKLLAVGTRDAHYRVALATAADLFLLRYEGAKSDSLGANHYLTNSLFHSTKAPSWSKGVTPVLQHGVHTFLKL